jgi:hypothetical protein
MNDFACLYFGPPDECAECGGYNETGTMHCSHDCAADHAHRAADMSRRVGLRRAEEDAFGAEVDRLRALGHTDEEIDIMLAGVPS